MRNNPVAPSLFRARENKLAVGLSGLILTIALLGELNNFDISPDASVIWLLGLGALLFGANVTSTLLAHVAATRRQPAWPEVGSILRLSVPTLVGAVAAALIMLIPTLAGFDAEAWLVACVVIGLAAVGALTLYATAFLRWTARVLACFGVVGFCMLIVLAGNTL